MFITSTKIWRIREKNKWKITINITKYIYYNFSEKLIVNDYPRKENKFFYFFMYNHGYDLLLFNIEYIYNYLLISNNNYNAVNFPVM